MDTIRNAANSASESVRGSSTQGESGQEPVAGAETGRGGTEPYDTGNTEGNPSLGGSTNPNAQPDNSGQSSNENTTERTGDSSSYGGGGEDTSSGGYENTSGGGSLGNPSGSEGIAQGGAIRSEHDTEKTGVTGVHGNDPKFSSEKPSSADTAGTGTDNVGPSVGADPSSGQKPEQKQQGADRPNEEPSSGGSSGGDQKEEKKSEGTGTKYVKSTGLASQGGDFDVTKPGAGREADRLLEEQGVSRDAGGPAGGAGGDDTSGGKPSIGSKVKDKFHIGSHIGKS
ncbi:MAG: hypothetical protein M1833_006869 [Piccolia ochrophora]|nr:MAG: hypothetical protein M1833_006869 [Piccolia ochrophora]